MLSIQFSILAFSTGLKYLTRKVNLPAEIPDQSEIYFTTNNLINNIVLTISQTIPAFHNPGNMKLSSKYSFSLEESKICRLVMG